MVAVIPDSSKVTVSPSTNGELFKYIKPTLRSFTFSQYIATDLLVDPNIFSPINKSPVLFVGPLNVENTKLGRSGLEVSFDSKTPYNLVTSGFNKQISSSSTLVPYA